jgi:hypothetical protein
MKTLCITGPLSQDLELVTTILQQAGMQAARPARGDDERDMTWWHAQVSAEALPSEDTTSPGLLIAPLLPQEVPGRLWENQASEIFLANLGAVPWGWADPQSLAVLDFWLDFDPRLNFILVCVRPEQVVARLVTGNGDLRDLSATLERWLDWHQTMLRYHHRHPQRCLLVDAGAAARDPQALVQLLIKHWPGIALSVPDTLTGNGMQPDDAIARHLAELLLAPFGEVSALQQELDATMPVASSIDESRKASESLEALLADYRGLRGGFGKIEQLENERIALQEAATRVAQQQKELQRENDLLLHQVQEESKALLLKQDALEKERRGLTQAKGELETQLANLQLEHINLGRARDEQVKLAADRQVQIAQLT